MRDPDLERRVEQELFRWVDHTGRSVVAPDVEHIHRRAESRTARGIAVTFAATTVAGLLLGAAVIGVGGIGMRDGQPAGPVAARPVATAAHATPTERSPTAPGAGAGGRGAAASAPASRPPDSSVPVPTSDVAPSPDAGPSQTPGSEPTRPAARGTPAATGVRPSAATPTVVPPTAVPPTQVPPTQVPPTTRPPTAGPTPSAPTPQSQTSATALGRPPLALHVAFRSSARDAQGCRTARRVDRTVHAPTPRSVVRAVLDGPTGAERGRGVGSVYGRDGRTTPASIAVDWGRRLVTVDLQSLSSVGISPAACRGREIRGPVLDALGQYDQRWSVRFTVRGNPRAFPRYLEGS